MQQRCYNCGNPVQPGSPVCATCGAPVNSAGAGSYDPTIQAGGSPGSGYGQQPYGSPSSYPYGAPPPAPGYGPPPSPGYGPQPGYGPPPVQLAPPPQKQSRTIWYLLGGCLVVVILVCIGSYFVLRAAGIAFVNAVNNAATQIATHLPNEHISDVQIGTGDSSGHITNQATTFRTSDTIVIDFTVTTQDTNGAVTLVITDQSSGQQIMKTLNPQSGMSQGYFSFRLRSTGTFTVELQYNHTAEYTNTITVTS